MAYAERRGKTWRAKYKKPDGTWGSGSGFKTKAAALAWAQDQETDIRRHTWIDPVHAEEKFAPFAERVFADARLAMNTRETYRSYLDVHILPQWKDWTLGAIFHGHMEMRAWSTQLHSRLAEPTVVSIFYYFSHILEEAVRARKIPGNPARMVKVTSGGYEPERQVATPVQVLRASMRLRESFSQFAMVLTLLNSYTGMRWSEQIGLYVYDYDELKHAVPVRTPLTETSRGKFYVASKTKTPTSKRWIQLPPFLDALYGDLRASRAEGPLFIGSRGGWLRRGNFRTEYWRPAWDGVPGHEKTWMRQPLVEGITFHEAGRHTHRTWLAEDEIPEVARAARLGHKVPGMARVYEHVTPRMQERILSVLETRWVGSVASLTDVERERLFTMAPVLEEHYKEATKGGLFGSPLPGDLPNISHLRENHFPGRTERSSDLREPG